jgi:hypothetical protein
METWTGSHRALFDPSYANVKSDSAERLGHESHRRDGCKRSRRNSSRSYMCSDAAPVNEPAMFLERWRG